MPSNDGTAIYVPEAVALAELDTTSRGNSKFSNITRQWLSWVREVSRLLQRINATGEQNGVVITDDTGTATVTANDMEAVTFNAADFTADSGNWTLVSGDVLSFARNRLGRMLTIAFSFATTTVSATPSELRVLLPGGFIAARAISTLCYLSDNGTAAVGVASVAAAGTTLVFTRLDGTAFATAADTTAVKGEIVIEVQ